MSDIAWSGADVRTEQARELIDRAADDVIPLVVTSAMHLCLLGVQTFSMFDEVPARAFAALSPRQRRQFAKAGLKSLQARGLLGPPERGSDDYPVSPEFGLVLAAMAAPPFIAATTAANRRSMKVFPLGETKVAVVEVPGAIPNPKRDFGPLGALYDYELMSLELAAQLLAEFAIHPDATPRKVTVFRPGAEPTEKMVTVRGDGTTAVLLEPDGQPVGGSPIDKAALAAVIGQAFQ